MGLLAVLAKLSIVATATAEEAPIEVSSAFPPEPDHGECTQQFDLLRRALHKSSIGLEAVDAQIEQVVRKSAPALAAD